MPPDLRDSIVLHGGDAPAHVDVLAAGPDGVVLFQYSEENNWTAPHCAPLPPEGGTRALALLEVENRLVAVTDVSQPAVAPASGARRVCCHVLPINPFAPIEDGYDEDDEVSSNFHFSLFFLLDGEECSSSDSSTPIIRFSCVLSLSP